MKKSLTLSLIFLCFILCSCSDRGEHNTFNKQIGIYSLDLKKTILGNYSKDSDKYKHLLITFKKDSTFIMNMKVPFMRDSVGTWIAGDGSPDKSNYLYYKNFSYSKDGTGEQFYPPYNEGTDSLFLINSTTPQKGFEPIDVIYFKKIRR